MNTYRPGILPIVALSLLLSCDSCKQQQQPDPDPSVGETTIAAEPQTITLATFNVRIFSNGSRDDQELEQIADVLELYDFVAIQELRDTLVLRRAVNELATRGYKYAFDASNRVGRGSPYELYAFLYRTDKIQLVTPGVLWGETNDEFIREPFYATFRSGNFDFTVITIHVLYGDSQSERRPEIIELANVFQAVQSGNANEQDVILVGDFNFPPTDQGWTNLKAIPTMTWLVNPPEKTTISDASLYDNFWFQSQYVTEYADSFDIYVFDEDVFGNDDQAASLAVSDHRPVWAVFRTDMQDDD